MAIDRTPGMRAALLLAAACDAVFAIWLGLAGWKLLAAGHSAVRSAGVRDEFAAGMVVTGSGLGVLVLALLLGTLAGACYLVYRRARRSASIGWGSLVLVAIALGVPVSLVAAIVWGH